MSSTTRRGFLAGSAGLALAATAKGQVEIPGQAGKEVRTPGRTEGTGAPPGQAGAAAADGLEPGLAARRDPAAWLPPRLALSSYSLWHFEGEPAPMVTVLEEAARLDLAGVDILYRQLTAVDRDSLRALRRRAFALGLDLVCLSTHQGFLSDDAASRQRNIEHTEHTLQVAAELGIPLIRVNTGNWGTLSFPELMNAKGQEDPPAGLTVEQGFGWVIEAYGVLAQRAEQLGVVMAMENHWGLSRRVEGQLRIVDAVDSPWLVPMLDTGNLLDDDRYEQMAQVAPRAALVQAKTYFGGGIYYDLDIDYARVRQILQEARFSGYVCLEAEGRMEPREAVRRSVTLLRDRLGCR